MAAPSGSGVDIAASAEPGCRDVSATAETKIACAAPCLGDSMQAVAVEPRIVNGSRRGRLSLRFHEISESRHRILNPYDHDKLMLLGEVCRLQPGQRILDLACGKGELLSQWSARWGVTGVGVDISEVFTPLAQARTEELDVADRVEIVRANASDYQPKPAAYDIVACVGATWIGNGVAGTIDLLRPALKPGGLILIGEPYWNRLPDRYPDWAPEGEFDTLGGLLKTFESAGCELIELVMANQDTWDRYVASQWWTMSDWLRDNGDDPDADTFRQMLADARRSHLDSARRDLGWGIFVLRESV
jgi:SAM-dependent methyltransferase